MSLIDATACAFVKVGVYSVLTDESLLPVLVKRSEEKPNEFISRKIKQQLDCLHKFSVEINYKTFVDLYKKIVPHIQTIGKTKVADKNEILNVFSLEKLCSGERKFHTIVECKGGLHNIQGKSIMSLFVHGIPTASSQLVSKAEKFGLKLQPPRVKQAKLVAKKVIKDLDNDFQSNFKIKFSFSEMVLSQLSHSEEKKKIKGALKRYRYRKAEG